MAKCWARVCRGECSPLPASSSTEQNIPRGRHTERKAFLRLAWQLSPLVLSSYPYRIDSEEGKLKYYRRQDEMDIRCIIIASLVIIL